MHTHSSHSPYAIPQNLNTLTTWCGAQQIFQDVCDLREQRFEELQNRLLLVGLPLPYVKAISNFRPFQTCCNKLP